MLKKLKRVTVNETLQIDTIFGTIVAILLITLLWLGQKSMPVSNAVVIFTVITVLVVLLNIVIDILGLKTKYPLMDMFLFLVIIIYFSKVYNNMYELYSIEHSIVRSVEFDFSIMADYEYAISRLNNTLYFQIRSILETLTFWLFVLVFGYGFYTFMLRYDSRFGGSQNRVTLGGLMRNHSVVSSMDPKNSKMTEAQRVNIMQEVNVYHEIDEVLERNRRTKEHEQKK